MGMLVAVLLLISALLLAGIDARELFIAWYSGAEFSPLRQFHWTVAEFLVSTVTAIFMMFRIAHGS